MTQFLATDILQGKHREPMKILIADDNPAIRLLLKKYLLSWGYDVLSATDGTEAWKIMLESTPDLAILDWMMPGYEGLDLCNMHQGREDLPFIYFLLLTSKHEKKDLLYALEHGAHDFQSKPIDRDELRIRISVGERLLSAHKKIQDRTMQAERFKQNADTMKQLAEDRAQQLIHADRLISLGTLSAGLAHEISNALGYICEGAYETQYQQDKIVLFLKKLLQQENLAEGGLLAEYLEESGPAIESIHEGINRVIAIIEELRMFSRSGGAKREPCPISECITRALRLTHNALKYHVTVEEKVSSELPLVMASGQQLEQVFVNLFKNAADAMEKQNEAALLKISAEADATLLHVLIQDTGPGIPQDKLETIWGAFYTSKPPEKGTGLGLAISRDIIQKHGGKIYAENLVPRGCCFHIELPIYHDDNS